jgi:hypothetical protein
MKTWLKRMCAVLALSVGVTVGFSASGASAINTVWCNEDGYLLIASTDIGDRCYANGGETELDIKEVWAVWSGNNSGYIDIQEGDGVTRRHPFPKWTRIDVDGYANYLHID